MNPIEQLEQEHEDIERELLELETISNSESINYSNLAHVFKRLIPLWNKHEEKEEKIFPIMKKERIIVPVKKMLFDHKNLRVHKKAIMDAINSGKGIKEALDNHIKVIIQKLREHIKNEDEILYTIAMSEFTQEEIKAMAKSVNL
jgi:hemerythrin-like domain-containing protein